MRRRESGAATIRRNQDYGSEFALWSDTLAKRPQNPQAHNDLGSLFYRQGRVEEAIAHFAEAVRLYPGYTDARNNLRAAQASQ